jgi:hypothetical protein
MHDVQAFDAYWHSLPTFGTLEFGHKRMISLAISVV